MIACDGLGGGIGCRSRSDKEIPAYYIGEDYPCDIKELGKTPAGWLVLAASMLLAFALQGNSPTPLVDAAATAAEAGRVWTVTIPANGEPWIIAYGSGVDFPQFAWLHPKSGYFRLVCKTTFGTSIVLPPAFWSGGY